MVSVNATVQRARRDEEGLTLIEVIVSLAILAIIGGVVGAVFAAGLRTLSSTGPQPRLLAAHDLMALEQALGKDGARAVCIAVPPGGRSNTYPKFSPPSTPGCSNPSGFASVACGASSLCFGWVQWTNPTSPACEVAVYQMSGNLRRTEYSASAAGLFSVASVPLAPTQPATLSVLGSTTVTPPGETYTWIRALSLGIATFSSGPAEQFTVQPVASDPAGTNAQLGAAQTAC